MMNSANFTLSILFVGQTQFPPYTYDCGYHTLLEVVHGQCNYPGVVSESIGLMLKTAGVKFSLHFQKHISFGESMKMLENGSYHTIPIPLTPTAQRLERLKASFPVSAWTDPPIAIGTARTEPDWIGKTSDFFNVYDPTIWTCAILLYFTAKFFRFVMCKLHNLNRNMKYRSELYFFVIISFFSIYFIGLYRSGLLAHIILKRHVQQFRTFDQLLELVERGRVKLAMSRSSGFMSEGNTDVRRMMAAFESNPPVYTTRFSRDVIGDYSREIVSGRMVAIGTDMGPNVVYSKMCGVRLVPLPTLGKIRNGFMFSPSVPKSIVDRIDRAMIRSQTVLLGIKQRYVNMLARQQAFLNCTSTEPKANRMGIYDLLGLFVILGFGLFLAGLIAVWERCFVILANFWSLDQRRLIRFTRI